MLGFDIVVAVDRSWGIGNANGLPWPRLSADLAHFKAITSSAPPGLRNAIVMGRKTWESTEVNRRPLPRRQTIVISRGDLVLPGGVLGAHSVSEALEVGRATEGVDQIYVVGGAQIYREALVHEQLRYAYVTRIDRDFQTDTRIPDLDQLLELDATWPAVDHEDAGIHYRIERRRRRA